MVTLQEQLVKIIYLEILFSGNKTSPKVGEAPKAIKKKLFKRGRPISKTSRCIYCKNKPTPAHKTTTITSGSSLEGNIQQTTVDICEGHIPALFAEASYYIKGGYEIALWK